MYLLIAPGFHLFFHLSWVKYVYQFTSNDLLYKLCSLHDYINFFWVQECQELAKNQLMALFSSVVEVQWLKSVHSWLIVPFKCPPHEDMSPTLWLWQWVHYDWFLHFPDDERAFGFVRVISGDEMSKRAKFVLITWCGTQVNPIKRARMSTDKTEVKRAIQVRPNFSFASWS